MQKVKTAAILLIIVISLIPVYLLNKRFQQTIRPKESLARLFFYILSGFALVFGYTFLVVFILKKLFPDA